jgi:hypothetical protein
VNRKQRKIEEVHRRARKEYSACEEDTHDIITCSPVKNNEDVMQHKRTLSILNTDLISEEK